MVSEGKTIEYIEQGKLICALCLQEKGKRLHLLTPTNREVNISPKRAILISEDTVSTARPRDVLLDHLRKAEEERNRLKAQVDVKELWELVHDENEGFTHKDLAQLCFGPEITDHHVSAVVRALFEDRLYFKLKEGIFVPNTPQRVEQIILQREEEARREERLCRGAEWLKAALKGGQPPEPQWKAYVVELLQQLALHGREAKQYDEAKELLERAGVPGPEKARQLLVELGIWQEDENLEILRAGIPVDFTPEQLQEADSLSAREIERAGVEDMTGLDTVTIDGPFTRDFDDAISLQETDQGTQLFIHIADVASVVEPETPLDREAFQRASSLYLPRRSVSMIPQLLSENKLSLKEGLDRPAITLLCTLDQAGEVKDYRFVASVVRVKRQLTYEQVNRDLEKDPELKKMFALAKALKEKRRLRGALNLSLPELQISVDQEGTVQPYLLDQGSPSRMIIAEFMILFNWLAGRFCKEHQIPALYRTQPPPSELIEQGSKPFIYYVFHQRRKLHPLLIDTTPAPHSTLGLEVYSQVSSPIRRYLDLVVQRQIRASLLGQTPPYNQDDLEKIRMATEPTLRELARIKRVRLRYWLLKFFSQNIGKAFPAVVLDELNTKYRLVLSQFLITTEVKKDQAPLLGPGQEVLVEVVKADPWEDTLVVKVVE